MGNPYSESFKFLTQNFLTYLPYMVLYYIFVAAPDALTHFGIGVNQVAFIWISVLITVLYLWLRSCILFKTRELKWNRPLGFFENLWEGACSTPAFVLYTFLHAIIVLIGLVMLIVPGVYLLVALYFAPILAVIEPDCPESYFSLSMTLVKNHFWMVFGMCMIFLFGDSFSLLSELIANETIKSIVNYTLMVPECILVVYVDILAVHMYLSFRNKQYYQESEDVQEV